MAFIDGRIKRLYFNLDATVLSARDDVLSNLNSAICEHGLEPLDPLQYEALWGSPLHELIQQATDCSPEAAALVLAAYRDNCRKQGFAHTAVIAEVSALLRDLKTSKLHVTCSSHYMPATDRLLQKLDLHDCFNDINESMHCRERYWSERLTGENIDHVCVVSDRPIDIKSANHLGCFTAAVTWGVGSDWDLGIEAPDVILNTVTEGAALFFEGQLPGDW